MKAISWGVGLQSTLMACMSAVGELPKVDAVIFADTGFERKHTYQAFEFYSKWLTERGLDVYRVEAGNIREDALSSRRFASPPYYTLNSNKLGQLRRQCTKDYKIRPITRKVRELMGLPVKGRVPKGVKCEQWIGITIDEIQRMSPSRVSYIENTFPLVELRYRRVDCPVWFEKRGLPVPGESSCVICPYHNDANWLDMKLNSPSEWSQAVDFDEAVRFSETSRGIESPCFVYWRGVPLSEAPLKNEFQLSLWQSECTGHCGL